MNTYDKLHSGKLYSCLDFNLWIKQAGCLEKLYKYNKTHPFQYPKRVRLLKRMFAEIGDKCYIEPPLHANWGGLHVHFGNNIYANFNLTLVDDTHIYVGDNTMFGPNVTILTATHTTDPEYRKNELQYNLPVHIGKNCWICTGAIIFPGVTIGDNSVVGAGSIVTKDVPSGVLVVGNPAHILRELGEEDRKKAESLMP